MSIKKKHIVLITSEFPPQPGGIGNHAYNLALNLDKSGYKVSVICDQRSSKGIAEKEFDGHQPFDVVRIRLRKFRPLMYFSRIRAFRSYIKNADAVLASGKFSLWTAGLFIRPVKCHRLAIVHGSELNFRNPVINWSIRKSLSAFDHVVAVSNYTASLIENLGLKISVIPNGIDFEKWKNGEGRMTLKGDPKLITVGRLSERKGQMQLIGHLPALIERFPGIHYHCVGIPQGLEKYKAFADTLGVRDHFTAHGVLDEDALRAALKDSDIFVMLSRETGSGDVEGFGIAILEANACGIPAIGSAAMGIPDAIDDRNSGLLVNPEKGDEIGDAISQILDNKAHFRILSLEWAQRHDWKNIIKEYTELLE